MKLAIFSDLHVHPWPDMHTVNEDGINTRLLDTLSIIKQVHKIAKAQRCEAILFSGDLFHIPQIQTTTLDLTARALADLELPLVMIPGNHDEASKYGDFHSIRVFNRIKPDIRVLDGREGTATKLPGGFTVAGIPFVGSNDTLIKEAKRARGADVLLCHTGFAGASAGFEYIADQKEYIQPADLRLKKRGIGWVIAGHFHDPQIARPGDAMERTFFASKYKFPKHSILVPGAPLHHTFGDAASERGCWILDVGMGTAEFIHLKYPRFIVTDGAGDKVDSDGIKSIFGGNFVRYRTKDKSQCQPIAEMLQEAGARGFRVELIRSTASVSRSKSELTGAKASKHLLRSYIKSTKKTGLPSKVLIKHGLRILGKAEQT